VNGEIIETITFRRPAGMEGADVLPEFVADAQGIGGSHVQSPFGPTAPFRFRNRFPVASRKRDQIFVSHRGRITKR
jgi:hypothetical protein